MKTIQEQIEVMTHYLNGGEIETTSFDSTYWVEVKFPEWDWSNQDYRIKEQKKSVVIKKWLIKTATDECLCVVEGTNEYLEHYFSMNQKVKLLNTYEVEL